MNGKYQTKYRVRCLKMLTLKFPLTFYIIILLTPCISYCELSAQDINIVQSNAHIQWQRSSPLADRYIAFSFYDDSERVILLTHYYGNYGLIFDAIDSSGIVIHASRQMPNDTQGYIYNAAKMARINDSTFRIYGHRCWYYSVPPVHLSKLSSRFSPALIETDNNFHIRSISDYSIDSSTTMYGKPTYCYDNDANREAILWGFQDSLRLTEYDKNLTMRLRSVHASLDTEAVHIWTQPYRINDNEYVSNVYVRSDSGLYYNYVYIFNCGNQTARRFRLSNPERKWAVLFRKDRVLSTNLRQTDSTAALHVYETDLNGQLLSDHSVLPGYSVYGELVAAGDGGVYVIGRAALPYANGVRDSNWKSLICKLDSHLNVQWYSIRGLSGKFSTISAVLERVDGSVWTVGYEGEGQGQLTRRISKYLITQDTVSAVAVEDEQAGVLYPNPATNVVMLHIPELYGSQCTISMFGVTGNEVYKRTLSTSETVAIDVHDFASGIYSVCIRGVNQVLTRHVLIR